MTKLETQIDKVLEAIEIQIFMEDITRLTVGQLITIEGVIFDTEYDYRNDTKGFIQRYDKVCMQMQNKRKQFSIEDKEERARETSEFTSPQEKERVLKLIAKSV